MQLSGLLALACAIPSNGPFFIANSYGFAIGDIKASIASREVVASASDGLVSNARRLKIALMVTL